MRSRPGTGPCNAAGSPTVPRSRNQARTPDAANGASSDRDQVRPPAAEKYEPKLEVVDGRVEVPSAPGWGVELVPSFVIRTGSGTYVATEDPGVFQQAQRFPEGAAADLQPARRRSFRRERAVPCGKSSDRMLARICSTTEAYNLGRPTAWNASSG